jgi:hypothetical protein
MRALGFILLIAGFAAMNWETLAARDIIYGAATDQMHRMPQQESYTREDVHLGVVRVAHDVWDRATPTFYFSGVAMLAGGLLAVFAPKRQTREKAQQDGAANGSQPNRSETNGTSSVAGSRR